MSYIVTFFVTLYTLESRLYGLTTSELSLQIDYRKQFILMFTFTNFTISLNYAKIKVNLTPGTFCGIVRTISTHL